MQLERQRRPDATRRRRGGYLDRRPAPTADAETWSHHYDQHDFDAFWA
jgi:hypothetical protein